MSSNRYNIDHNINNHLDGPEIKKSVSKTLNLDPAYNHFINKNIKKDHEKFITLSHNQSKSQQRKLSVQTISIPENALN
jgi:hypothetical protein